MIIQKCTETFDTNRFVKRVLLVNINSVIYHIHKNKKQKAR
ncbi:hypothetical protein BAOM_1733 [Peribacillus asahii]|uniref:Uncharacterized protein n=1 Tax=Peribacillus asahii TaxID=228899 RepID=A0A3T0KPZ7_9BACI|nr:hypothetical protein BAOM_1733 [Peribacillus asahii]